MTKDQIEVYQQQLSVYYDQLQEGMQQYRSPGCTSPQQQLMLTTISATLNDSRSSLIKSSPLRENDDVIMVSASPDLASTKLSDPVSDALKSDEQGYDIDENDPMRQVVLRIAQSDREKGIKLLEDPDSLMQYPEICAIMAADDDEDCEESSKDSKGKPNLQRHKRELVFPLAHPFVSSLSIAAKKDDKEDKIEKDEKTELNLPYSAQQRPQLQLKGYGHLMVYPTAKPGVYSVLTQGGYIQMTQDQIAVYQQQLYVYYSQLQQQQKQYQHSGNSCGIVSTNSPPAKFVSGSSIPTVPVLTTSKDEEFLELSLSFEVDIGSRDLSSHGLPAASTSFRNRYSRHDLLNMRPANPEKLQIYRMPNSKFPSVDVSTGEHIRDSSYVRRNKPQDELSNKAKINMVPNTARSSVPRYSRQDLLHLKSDCTEVIPLYGKLGRQCFGK